ncbi:Domain of uncharacterised function (DUF2825) [Nocardia farcinica]|nr:Domain of uncharacterised function (DUF2825) [Nocardia farcinica]
MLWRSTKANAAGLDTTPPQSDSYLRGVRCMQSLPTSARPPPRAGAGRRATSHPILGTWSCARPIREILARGWSCSPISCPSASTKSFRVSPPLWMTTYRLGSRCPSTACSLPVSVPLTGDYLRGLIPARAGSTSTATRHCSAGRAHPRTRGEHDSPGRAGVQARGSSPHARGARVLLGAPPFGAGLIPARAGSTLVYSRPSRRIRAHPRTRGEHDTRGPPGRRDRGSSPHARGARDLDRREEFAHGLIPARAGSTAWPPAGRWCPRAHPRTRGEHCWASMCLRRYSGSSPHARGAPRLRPRAARQTGLIPARAGSTGRGPRCGTCRGAHPRTRGEHRCCACVCIVGLGSSPHARGALDVAWTARTRPGLIPARAGSTCSRCRGRFPNGAHPRTRGEHTS